MQLLNCVNLHKIVKSLVGHGSVKDTQDMLCVICVSVSFGSVARALNAHIESACSFSICLFGIYLFVPLVGKASSKHLTVVIEWRVPDFPQSR